MSSYGLVPIETLAEARRALDREVIRRASLERRLVDLEAECEALREMVAALAKAAGGGAEL